MTDVTDLQPLSIEDVDKAMKALAGEIACDSFDMSDILKTHRLTVEQFKRIEASPRFQMFLRQAISDWNSTANTQERSKSKAALAFESLLPDMSAVVLDTKQPLSARVELYKTIMKAGGIGEKVGTGAGESGERFSVTINLGGENSLKIEQILPSKVIEGEAL